MNFISRCSAVALALAFSLTSHATIVEVETSRGDFKINLYDDETPLTVQNFLSYVESGAYDGSVFHRLVHGFVLQGGGFTYEGQDSVGRQVFPSIEVSDPVSNEPVFSNVKATVAMAKIGGDPDSATSGWFINLADNSSNLDRQNGGFTAFGEVVEGDYEVVEALAQTPVTSNALPLADMEPGTSVNDYDESNLLVIERITIIDSATNTAASLSPVPNTLIHDLDDDGVLNDDDSCANTNADEVVDENGCALYQVDTDDDGVNDALDQCPDTVTGTRVGIDGCESTGSDGGGSGSLWLFALLGLGLLVRKQR
ncbi:peptidylprolyl isomerase [Agaribacterium sp. ZY112]|uniref:peptidylprolyl isomerase n=1 Tax=Agaribacterium sp. ZY112 TaxID=3233574 RepID=UPI00352357FA